MKRFMAILVAGVVVLVVGTILNGYVLSVLWAWFIVPTFGAPELAVVPAIGLAFVVSYLTQHVPKDKEEETKSLGEQVAEAAPTLIMKPLVGLFLGWVVHLFM